MPPSKTTIRSDTVFRKSRSGTGTGYRESATYPDCAPTFTHNSFSFSERVKRARQTVGMGSQVALLRAVNVGGNKLPMKELKAMGQEAGFEAVSTYIASGNLIFRTDDSQERIRLLLEARLADFFGKPMDVLIRSARELSELVEKNPFADQPGNRVVVLFLDQEPPAGLEPSVPGQAGERFVPGDRELFIHYPEGQGRSKLAFKGLGVATARNMNTVAKLAALARELE